MILSLTNISQLLLSQSLNIATIHSLRYISMSKKNKGLNRIATASKNTHYDMVDILNATLRDEIEMEEDNHFADQMMNM